MPSTIGIFKEVSNEPRVSLDPATCKKLTQAKVKILLEEGAGEGSCFSNKDYEQAGVQITSKAKILQEADFLLWINNPEVQTIEQLAAHQVVIAPFYAHNNKELTQSCLDSKITTLALELIPRITRAQGMDILSSQASVAGYYSVLIAASESLRFFPMLTTAAGTIRPAKVLVIGAGVAGLQAIATAKRLGAMVEAYDIRPAAREQVESLGAVMVDTGVSAEGGGGYARELTNDEKAQQQKKLAEHIAKSHCVICTAAIPGRAAPKIVNQAMVENMPAGAVIVDMAAASGGNCELTKAGETIQHGSVKIVGAINLQATLAINASEMWAKNIFNLISPFINQDGDLQLDKQDEVIQGCLLTEAGEAKHESIRADYPTQQAIQQAMQESHSQTPEAAEAASSTSTQEN